MTTKHGDYLGSVRCVKTLRERCVIGDAGCWHLRSARGRALQRNNAESGKVVVPKLHVYGRGQVSARRAAWDLSHDAPAPSDKVVGFTCGSYDCVNPRHLRLFSHVEFGAHMRATGAAATPRKRAAALRLARTRKSTKLTGELAQWARESGQRQGDIAHALGVSQQRVSDIRSGRSWAEPRIAGASVFALAAG